MRSSSNRVWYFLSALFFVFGCLSILMTWTVYESDDYLSGTLIAMTLVCFFFTTFILVVGLDQNGKLSSSNLRIGRISRIFGDLASCRKCQTTWMFVTAHVTSIPPHGGRFALCEKCWSELTPETRIQFYQESFGHHSEWPLIEQAVFEGR